MRKRAAFLSCALCSIAMRGNKTLVIPSLLNISFASPRARQLEENAPVGVETSQRTWSNALLLSSPTRWTRAATRPACCPFRALSVTDSLPSEVHEIIALAYLAIFLRYAGRWILRRLCRLPWAVPMVKRLGLQQEQILFSSSPDIYANTIIMVMRTSGQNTRDRAQVHSSSRALTVSTLHP